MDPLSTALINYGGVGLLALASIALNVLLIRTFKTEIASERALAMSMNNESLKLNRDMLDTMNRLHEGEIQVIVAKSDAISADLKETRHEIRGLLQPIILGLKRNN